jgi:hypothetical protein
MALAPMTPELVPSGSGTTPPEPAAFALVIRGTPGNWQAGPVQRLKGVLKRLLRSYGFRCLSARPATEKDLP